MRSRARTDTQLHANGSPRAACRVLYVIELGRLQLTMLHASFFNVSREDDEEDGEEVRTPSVRARGCCGVAEWR